MGDTILGKTKAYLDESISDLDAVRDLYIKHPGVDFTRTRKISFTDVFKCMINWQGKSTGNEIMDHFGHHDTDPSASAFIQQRDKIDTGAFEFLMHTFDEKCQPLNDLDYRGYRLLACDGSDFNISRDPDDEETFINEGEKGYNMMHVNAFYDLQNLVYTDITFQGKKKVHEREACNRMLDRVRDGEHTIVIMDRGFESFNTFAHAIENGVMFVTRLKDIDSNGILSAYELPDGEFDMDIKTTLTRRHTKETKGNPDKYTILHAYTDFDYLTETQRYYDISFRIVRFRIADGSYGCVATNLPREEFPPDVMSDLYHRRWGEETSFRELKYTIGAVNFHSKKRDFIKQEIYTRVVFYNFCSTVTNHAEIETGEDAMHEYQINFSAGANVCREYLKNGGDEAEMMRVIQRHLTPIRNNRNYPRNVRPQRNRNFMYRAS